jgi:hypothetical protein
MTTVSLGDGVKAVPSDMYPGISPAPAGHPRQSREVRQEHASRVYSSCIDMQETGQESAAS